MPPHHPLEHPGLLQDNTPTELGARGEVLLEKHADYIRGFAEKDESDIEMVMSNHFRMSGVYWGLCGLYLTGHKDYMDEEKTVAWVKKCQKEDGSFGATELHDGCLLYTLSAIQILAIYGRECELDADRIADYCVSLQREDGSFMGDKWGEVDTRFSYCALSACSLLRRLHKLNVAAAVDHILRCQNFDGSFGVSPGCESHTGQVFCCVGALSIAGALDRLDTDRLGRWLSERQTPSGGMQGRPQKLQDVCYSWWALSALKIMGKLHWIDGGALRDFILYCQDEHGGGISDRPDDMVDVFHTFFGLGALALMDYPGLQPVDPTYALPVAAVERILR